jgi:hypothetical protein
MLDLADALGVGLLPGDHCNDLTDLVLTGRAMTKADRRRIVRAMAEARQRRAEQ